MYNFSYFHFQFSTFPFKIVLLFFPIVTPFPFFPETLAQISRSEVSGGHSAPRLLHHCCTGHSNGVDSQGRKGKAKGEGIVDEEKIGRIRKGRGKSGWKSKKSFNLHLQTGRAMFLLTANKLFNANSWHLERIAVQVCRVRILPIYVCTHKKYKMCANSVRFIFPQMRSGYDTGRQPACTDWRVGGGYSYHFLTGLFKLIFKDICRYFLSQETWQIFDVFFFGVIFAIVTHI